MSITYSFSDNITYGTDDVNDITRRLTGAGIAPFPSKDSYNVSDFNEMTSALVETGTSLEGCKCSIQSADGTNTIEVGQGIAFFENGAVLEVDSDGYTVTAPITTPGYVYAYFNTALQTADIMFAEELPTDGYTVLLAQINEDNTLTDRRVSARSKVATFGRNAMQSFVMKGQSPEEYDGQYIVQRLSGVDLSKFNYAVLVANGSWDETTYDYFPNIGYHGAFFDLAKKKMTMCYESAGNDAYWNPHAWFYLRTLSEGRIYYYIKVISGELCIVCEHESAKAIKTNNALNCTVCLL